MINAGGLSPFDWLEGVVFGTLALLLLALLLFLGVAYLANKGR